MRGRSRRVTPENYDSVCPAFFHTHAMDFLWLFFLFFPVQGIRNGPPSMEGACEAMWTGSVEYRKKWTSRRRCGHSLLVRRWLFREMIGRLLAGGFPLIVGIGAQGIAEVAVDGCGVTLHHVVLGFEESYGWTDGLFWKGEDLETVTVEGKQVFIDERVSGHDIVVDTEVKEPADPVIAVKGNAISICCEDEEEVKEKLVVGEALQKAVLKEPVLDKGKASGDLSTSFGCEWGSVNHGSSRNGFRFSSWRSGSASWIHAF